ncbi:MAG: DUF4139 domain-containing protein [Paracoccus sp. (in: a-proteobacteria)]|uniref:DUF4139 domain-containing protein n=1 Tax=Paracoccus sp. TaxID=267 RepID=UPI0026E01C21|nr:DUF4139 domain-containing protein [Paracoccus sp. (in: a-proteobacteria)]MDO5632125.1 DUF4139 domain-containing protein [Paracoccus sp. (in: a-proteobacteria)]
MTRLAALFAATTALTSLPALADVIRAQARISDILLHSQGATITREAVIDAPAGQHQLILPGLPAGIDAASLRIQADGATVASLNLQHSRATPDDRPETPDMTEARAEVDRLEKALRDRDAATAAIRAEAQTAEDTIAFLRDLAKSEGAAAGDVAALASTVQAQILTVRRQAIWAENAARDAETGRDNDQRALDAARARLNTLTESPLIGPALVLDVQITATPATLRISHDSPQASWQPVYDLRLDRAANSLILVRGALVSQSTGEDWTDVALRLSTARPGGQSQATEVAPEIVRTEAEPPMQPMGRSMDMEMTMPEALAAPEPAAMGYRARKVDLGLTVAYDMPAPVTIRDGADALRLTLDQSSLTTPEIYAEAAPRYDSSAYLTVEAVNDSGAPILPGPATLFADGTLTGQTHLDLLAAGDRLHLGFGPIDGLKIERRLPDRSEGSSGLIRRSNTETETAILRVENLTDTAWPLRLVDRVPVSEQESLRLSWSADPTPSETDPEGKRGVLIWRFDIAPGETRQVTVQTDLTWPEGNILLRGW